MLFTYSFTYWWEFLEFHFYCFCFSIYQLFFFFLLDLFCVSFVLNHNLTWRIMLGWDSFAGYRILISLPHMKQCKDLWLTSAEFPVSIHCTWYGLMTEFTSPAACVCVCVCVCFQYVWHFSLSGYESYESWLCNWNVMRTGEEFDWTAAFSHAPASLRQMSNSFPNEKWHSPNPFLLLLLRSRLSVGFCDPPLPIWVAQWLTAGPATRWNIKINARLNQGLKECQCIHHFYLRLNCCVIDGATELAIQLQ